MIIDSLVVLDMLLLYLKAEIVKEYEEKIETGYQTLRVFGFARLSLLLMSFLPFLMFFTRRSIRSIVIIRLVLDGTLLVCGFVFCFLSLLKYLNSQV